MSDIITAHHEAGHVVAYLAHHRRFRYVTIRPRTAGITGWTAVRPRRIDLNTGAVIAHAGPLAEGMYNLSTYQPGQLEEEGIEACDVETGAYLTGGHGDMEAIDAASEAYGDGLFLEEIARELLTDRWQQVVAIAECLVERSTLTYNDVLALVAS
jgi:hypothetical protein